VNSKKWIALLVTLSFITINAHAAPVDRGDGWGQTGASNTGGISNTRHNLTVEFALTGGFGLPTFMDYTRNDYREVCVYCHTPHGANTTTNAPLWNRPAQNTSYTLYSMPTSTGQPVTNPGPNSLTCLSCHDGTLAIDAIINMPGSGKYDADQDADNAFLNTWGNFSGIASSHSPMGGCTAGSCHNRGNPFGIPAFEVLILGSDLRNDHPIGITYPEGSVSTVDFNPPTHENGIIQFFELNANNKPDSNEIRLYDTGDGYEVECASCHDPHGVMDPNGSTFIAGFLRVSNDESALCLTCHVK